MCLSSLLRPLVVLVNVGICWDEIVANIEKIVTTFEYQFLVNAPLDRVWQFHDDPMALTKVMTFPVKAVVHSVDRPVQPGSKVQMTFWFGPLPVKWNVVVRERTPPYMFRDEQPGGEGPFLRWNHRHQFEVAQGGRSTRVIDRIDYEPPFGAVGKLLDGIFGRFAMRLMFVGRERATRRYLETVGSCSQNRISL